MTRIRLEKEVERLQLESIRNQEKLAHIVVLESLLDDMTRLKLKYENDYRAMYEKNLGLESLIQKRRSSVNASKEA